MKNNWNYKKIDKIAEKIGMGPFGSSIKVETFVPKGIPIISGQHLKSYRLNENNDFNFISEEHAERLKNANVFRGDVIFTHAGNIENVSYIPENSKYERYVASQRQFFMRCNKEIVLPEWIVYFFRSHEGKHKLLANSSSVGVPSIAQPVSYLRQIEIPVPPLHIQQQIIKILDTFEDKIELNRQMNQTFEAMARAIFKSWFVDFDPVYAKMEGRDYPLPPEIMDLFPDELEESELGLIPKGWRVGIVGDIANNSKNVVHSDELGEVTFYIGLEHMPRRNIALDTWDYSLKVTSNKYSFRKGNILFGKLRPYFHKVGIAPIDGICSTDIIVVNGKDSVFQNFLLFLMSSAVFVDTVSAASTGTKMPRTDWKYMQSYKLPLPPEIINMKFDSIVEPMVEKISLNVHKTKNLEKLREVLLPKLMSGELIV